MSVGGTGIRCVVFQMTERVDGCFECSIAAVERFEIKEVWSERVPGEVGAPPLGVAHVELFDRLAPFYRRVLATKAQIDGLAAHGLWRGPPGEGGGFEGSDEEEDEGSEEDDLESSEDGPEHIWRGASEDESESSTDVQLNDELGRRQETASPATFREYRRYATNIASDDD
jgi:hypothetical protein